MPAINPKDCVDGTMCQICKNKEMKKGLFGFKVVCTLGYKPVTGKCFYFSCIGAPNNPCKTCSHYRRGENVEE